MVEYGRYAMQLEPWLDAYGVDAVYPMFLERLRAAPQSELNRLAAFLGLPEPVAWRDDLGRRNVSAERLRKCWWRDALVRAPGLAAVRRRVVPQRWRDAAKAFWRMRQRPALSPEGRLRLEEIYDGDLERLGRWMGVPLCCENFTQTVLANPLGWDGAALRASERAGVR